MEELKFSNLSKLEQDLILSAEKVMETAYNPYSNFYVGCAILDKNGNIYTGSNVENSAYGSTICAERSAILKANSENARQFRKFAIITRGNNFDCEDVSAPCGSCRQMIYEFSQIDGFDTEIYLVNTRKTKVLKTTIGELLPLPFEPRDLGINLERFK